MAKPDRRVQINLRVRESERRKLVKAAQDRGTTLNGLMARLLMSALEQERVLDAEQIVETTVRRLLPLLGNVHELNVSGDYRRAVGKLLALLRPLLAAQVIDRSTSEAIHAIIDEINAAERLVEVELGRRLARMHTIHGRGVFPEVDCSTASDIHL